MRDGLKYNIVVSDSELPEDNQGALIAYDNLTKKQANSIIDISLERKFYVTISVGGDE